MRPLLLSLTCERSASLHYARRCKCNLSASTAQDDMQYMHADKLPPPRELHGLCAYGHLLSLQYTGHALSNASSVLSNASSV
mmetsp:Transcript_73194/g.200975  ORF Transcript_73194/g.200975 Transcript_73194/m.200975 type:complete len:82 (-) Transcript_73194:1084-1329(-)